jgi:hypothetical protein
MPLSIKGIVEGSTTVLKSSHSDAPKLRAAVRRLYGVVLTPSRVLIRMPPESRSEHDQGARGGATHQPEVIAVSR